MAKAPEPPPLKGLLGDEHEHLLIEGVPHAQALGLTMVEMTRANAVVKLPYDPRLIGNPETGVIHGGAVTTLLDNVSGLAVFAAMEELTSIATLDLRIDYMRAATPGKDILGHAYCYKVTRTIAFVRGEAYEDSPDDPIATCTGAFMLGANAGRKPGANNAGQGELSETGGGK
jgi:uncharacterized protein (TIGR00369 family)